MTEVWFRNPDLYIREMVEILAGNVVWDRGYLVKRRVDPDRFGALYFPTSIDWRMLLVGEQGAAELTRDHPFTKPRAVYPVWEYGVEAFPVLEELMANPIGADADACADTSVSPDERPVLGQEHRVVIIRPPIGGTGPGRLFFRELAELQREYPDCIVHVHGLYSYRIAFGMGFRAADTDPRVLARKGKVTLPSGKEMTYENTARVPQWVTVVGMNPSDLAEARNRCIFNMRSAQWAGEHFTKNVKFKSRGKAELDPDAPHTTIPTTIAVTSTSARGTVGDKVACDVCSLQNTCKYFREGSVCSLPDTETAILSRTFKTRDADVIIDGLGELLDKQQERLSRGLADEEEYEELNPEVTKMIDSMFSNGVKLAKLLRPDPKGPQVGVFIGAGGHAAVAAGHANGITAAVVAELEAQGIPRDRITPELITAYLGKMQEAERAELSPGVPSVVEPS